MSFRLRIIAGKGAGQELVFDKPRVRIGRQPDNDLVLQDNQVSRYHCELLQDEGGYTLTDVGSHNGILLNDQVVTEGRVQDGDTFIVGSVTFSFTAERSAAKKPSGRVASKTSEDSQKTIPKATKNHERLTPTDGKPAAHASVRKRRRRVSGPLRAAILATGALLTIAALGGIWRVIMRPPKDRSGELFTLSEAVAKQKFGAGKVDVYTPDRVSFQFPWRSGRVRVSYAAGGVDSPTEVAVLVNGQKIGHAPLTGNAWITGASLLVPRASLLPGTNILTFDDTLTPTQKDERWGVAQVTVIETPLPPQDEKRAHQLLELGKASFESRSVTPQNLWRAVGYFDEASMHVEGMQPAPALLTEIETAWARAKDELQSVYDQHIIAAEKAMRFNDAVGAAEILRELLRYFPEPEDPRHAQAKERLNQLATGAIQ